MAETANTIPPSGIGTIRWIDVWKGFVKSCGGLILGLIIKMIQDQFKLPTYGQIEPLLEATAYFFLSYLGLNAATNNVGQLFKADQPVTVVDSEHLKNLQAKADSADQAIG